MSFVRFLGWVAKLAFGYIGGFFLVFAGIMIAAQGSSIIGGLVGLAGFVLMLFGVYTEKVQR
ncbi:hypothetical protein [Natronosalvus caseinilyticus]|uniref:hypothetical protein n=1 Tax=Natronosalvus caseinilyticus TaxID=2953747 RepID=UPI0028A581F6|nr:hypothetical protein [Natronosalvus caseinilyticus]